MKNTKKLMAVLMVLALAFGALAACTAPTAAPAEAATEAPAAEPAAEAPAATEAPAAPAEAAALDRAELKIPDQYTKVKIFDGTYGFGDAEITAAMTEDESAFYITYVSFDEDQILEGTVKNGICLVTYDATGFMSGDCQLIYDDALASTNPWQPLTGSAPAAVESLSRADLKIPEQYTKVKIFDGTYGFGDAEITAAMTEDESAFYITYVSFDEDQILEGTVKNGICLVTYDATGFMSGDCQLIYDDALASTNPWQPLV